MVAPKLSPQITLGNLVQLIGIVIAGTGFYFALKGSVDANNALLERQSSQIGTQAAQLRIVDNKVNDLKIADEQIEPLKVQVNRNTGALDASLNRMRSLERNDVGQAVKLNAIEDSLKRIENSINRALE